MIQEHEQAVLVEDLADTTFKKGDVGTVVHIYADGTAYEIEFFALDGHTLDVVTVGAKQVRAVRHSDVMHVREMSI